MPAPRDTDTAFGNWLAGFIDGEGCFLIWSRLGGSGKPNWACTFRISLRDDDLAILEEICSWTGIGSVFREGPKRASKPSCRWEVNRKADCGQLVAYLDTFPLRAKKARDFALWRRAVIAWETLDYPVMEQLRLELNGGRRYACAA